MKHLCSAILVLWVCTAASGQSYTIPQLRTQLANARHDTTRIRLCKELGYLYVKLKTPSDSAYLLFQQGIALAKKNKLLLQEAQLYSELGYYYKRLNQYPKAQAIYLAALELDKKNPVTRTRWSLLYRLGSVYGDQGKYREVIQTITTALNVAEQIKDSVASCYSIALLSSAYMDVRNIPAALLYARNARKLATLIVAKHPDKQELLVIALGTFTHVYTTAGQYDRAYPYLKQLLDYYVSRQESVQIAQAANDLGHNLLQQKKPLAAIRHLNESIRQKWINIPESETYENFALAYQQLGRPGTALTYARKAYTIALKKGHLNQIQSTLGTLVKLEEGQKLYPEALAHLRQLSTINDSLFTAEKAKAIADVEARYQLNQKEQTIDLLQKAAALRKITLERNQQELTAQRQRQLILALFVLLLLMGLIGLYLVFRREQTTRRLLALQKEDIEAKATQLQQLNTLKDNLFSIIGHDLRSPLAALKVQLNDLANRQVTISPDEPGYLRMSRLADNVYTTTDNLLNWSLLQRGGMKLWATTFDLAEVAKSVEQLLSSQLRQKQLRLTISLQPAPVLADERQLEIVVRNLLHNAIKFTPEGGSIQVRTGQQQGRSVLTIQDTGIGMTDNDHTAPADLHSRPHSANSGTGLGLTICREFVKLNGGELHIRSTTGKGTTVTVTFAHTPAVLSAYPYSDADISLL